MLLGKSKEFKNQGMKGKFKRPFKSYIFCQKKKKKKKIIKTRYRLWMKFSSTPKNLFRGAYIPNFKINALIFCCFLFFEEDLNSQIRMNKMVKKLTDDYHPNSSLLTSRINPLIFIYTVSLAEFFLKPVCSTVFCEIIGKCVTIIDKCIC